MTLKMLVVDVLLVAGAFFFVAGTVGLLRFPDVFTRLHALTKADNVGLGLVAAGVAVESGAPAVMLKIAVVWLLVLVSSALSCQLIARAALEDGVRPWRRK
jgi:multicomponent Na+:H+ antiporter subunit G